jgi:predicted DNA-binding transcriptional regulator AlpA
MKPSINTSLSVALPHFLEHERILSAKQAADLFGVSIATFRRGYWAGEIPAPIRLSERRLGWRIRDFLEHLSKRTKPSA